ncbi:hypothetical protein Q5O24_02435 [Eubacteriaceae bacterium ES3]|nr:hypothetical protein Q5O24_02435 [Eubacteriaceae bacterium ES3]
MKKINIITSNDAGEFARQISEAVDKGGRLVGGIKSVPKKEEDQFDYVTFVSYDQSLLLS